jgi:hypothetical protein
MIRNTIKKILKEEIERKNLEDIIRKYRYESNLLDQYAEKMDNGGDLNDIEINLAHLELNAIGVFGKIKDILKFIKKNTNIQDIIKAKGDVVYKRIISGPKKDILSKILLDKVYQVGKPSKQWFISNIQDMEKIISIFPRLSDKLKNTLSRCRNGNFLGIIKKDGDNLVWSILNKVNTNYINWGDLMSEKIASGHLKQTRPAVSESGEVDQYIEEYFIQRNINQLGIDNDLISILNEVGTKALSFAELDLIEAFYLDVNNKSTQKIDNILANIQSTTSQGDNVEKNFIEYIKKYNFVEDIHNFSTPGNLVDMNLGIDLLAKIKGTYYAVQVKSNRDHAVDAKIKYLPVNYLIIYPKDEFEPEEFYYITKKTDGGDFNKLMSDLSEKTTDTAKTPPKPPPSVDYLGSDAFDK